MEDIIEKIKTLKEQKNAIIMAHFYQPPQIQKNADFVGDSLELSRLAKESSAETIVVCGVYFMAESAKILSPKKTVLLPQRAAGCPMADMVQTEDINKLRNKYPDAAVVAYVNSSAKVKAESDICCTSSNAVKIVESLPNKEIIFIPDKNLGSYVARFTDKKIILFNGYCPVHNRINIKNVEMAKKEHPNAPILVHPECPKQVADMADVTGSTSQIINFITSSDKEEFVIGTEEGILYPLKLKNPDKKFHVLAEDFICRDMKKTSLEDVVNCLETGQYNVELDKYIIEKASKSLNRMLSIR